jgi:glycosyltransferase involved in cell wall biosynthesis
VPSCVTDGFDALLVPPKDARALAQAIELLICDGELRRSLIRNGLLSARKQTLDRFIATVLGELNRAAHQESTAIAQE